jgi:hypothetical protein
MGANAPHLPKAPAGARHYDHEINGLTAKAPGVNQWSRRLGYNLMGRASIGTLSRPNESCAGLLHF